MSGRIGVLLVVECEAGQQFSVAIGEERHAFVANADADLFRQVGGDDHVARYSFCLKRDDEFFLIHFVQRLECPEHTGKEEEKNENQELLVPDFGKAIPECAWHVAESFHVFARCERRCVRCSGEHLNHIFNSSACVSSQLLLISPFLGCGA